MRKKPDKTAPISEYRAWRMERYEERDCKEMPLDVYLKFSLLTHPSNLRSDRFYEAFPEIVGELRRDIEKYGRRVVWEQVEKEHRSYHQVK